MRDLHCPPVQRLRNATQGNHPGGPLIDASVGFEEGLLHVAYRQMPNQLRQRDDFSGGSWNSPSVRVTMTKKLTKYKSWKKTRKGVDHLYSPQPILLRIV